MARGFSAATRVAGEDIRADHLTHAWPPVIATHVRHRLVDAKMAREWRIVTLGEHLQLAMEIGNDERCVVIKQPIATYLKRSQHARSDSGLDECCLGDFDRI